MKILWLTPLFPYPLYSGGQIRAYHLLKNLAKKHQVTLFSFWRPNREQGPISELKKFCHRVKTFEGRKTWTARNVFLAGFSHLPFTVTHFWGYPNLKRALRKELETNDYDLVHFESFYTTPFLQTDLGVPTVLGNQNIEHLIYQRFAQGKNNPFLKLALQYDVLKMKRYEESAWKRAGLNLAVSETDARKIKKVTGKKCEIIPNGVEMDFFKNFKVSRPPEDRPDLLFVGDFKYFANQDALRFLTRQIWPKIKAELPKVKLWLVGKNPGKFSQSLSGKDVVVDTRVKDIRQAFSQADLMVVPMRIGSGTSLKVLEAMAMGLPIISTSVGIEGIKAKKDREVVVADKPQEMADQVIKLLKNKRRRQDLARAGQKLVENHYRWSKIAQKLGRAYQRLINEAKKT